MDFEYHPQILFVLRLNADGTDAKIEPYPLSRFPELDGLFGYPKRTDRNIDPFEEAKLVEKCVGAGRIIAYDTRPTAIQSNLDLFHKNLQYYNDCIKRISGFLKEAGYGNNVRFRSNRNFLNICNYFDTFYLFDKPFIELACRLNGTYRTETRYTVYDVPCWVIDLSHSNVLAVYHKSKLVQDMKKPFEEWLKFICKEPDDSASKKEVIKEQVENTFGLSLKTEDIKFDPASNCYLLSAEIEEKMLKDILPEHDDKPEKIAKYTTFETLIEILKSGKIRMNSIVSMNDKTEIDFLEGAIRNYKDDDERDIDKYLFADKEFITSFTTKIDELDMWRLYGDNAKGVCLVFKRKNKENDNLYRIKYIDPSTEVLDKVEKLLEALKKDDVRFHLRQLHKFQHFIKHQDYTAEQEYRLLVESDKPDGWFVNRDNGILTPYIERSLTQTDNNDYPFLLDEIILGPAIKEKMANLMQGFYMTCQVDYSVAVSTSKIVSYR